MGTAGRVENFDVSLADLRKVLLEHPGRFNFFQAVRLIHRMMGSHETGGPVEHPAHDLVRFKANNQLKFPAGQIETIKWPADEAAQMWVNFMGLTGPAGVLPYLFTEFIIAREVKKDRCLRDFFDLFNHRMISLFYRAWEKHHVFASFERDPHQRFGGYLRSLIGVDTLGLHNRLEVSDQSLLYYTGLLSLQPRSAAALEQFLEDYFQVPVEVEQFVGAWYQLQKRDQCSFRDSPSLSDQLGDGAIVGDAVWDGQCKVSLKLGPLNVERYLDFLPTGKSYAALKSVTQFFGRGQVEFEVQLILRQEEVPICELGQDGETAPMLNWFSWLKSSPVFDRSPSDAFFSLN